jgi:hypothetical protein
MKEFNRHLIDCGIGWLIGFMTASLAVEEFTFRVVLLSFIGAGIPALLKLRDYNASKINKKGSVTMNRIFFLN